MGMHSTYLASCEIRTSDGKRVELSRPCCSGCGWAGAWHRTKRSARQEIQEHLAAANPVQEEQLDLLDALGGPGHG